MNEFSLPGALLIGLLGSTHCLGMCGGLAAVMGQGATGPWRLLSYNLGRLLTYGVLGGVAGALGATLLSVAPALTLVLRLLAALLLVAMGLYISRWWLGLTRLERIGSGLWRVVQPVTRHLLPVTSHRQALLLGMCWGLLPCGLVYSTLTWALATADWRQSALLMVAFGLGTVPAMLSVGLLHEAVLARLRRQGFRTLAGVCVIAMGVWTAAMPLQHGIQGHGTPMADHEDRAGHQH